MTTPLPTSSEPGRARPALSSRWLLVGGVLFALAMVGCWEASHWAEGWTMIDLDVYRWGGETARTSSDLYTSQYHGFLLFTYTPMAAVVFMPMSQLSFETLQVVMAVASIAAIVIAAWASLGSLGYARDRGRLGLTLAIAAVAVTLEPVYETLTFGQVNLLLLAIIVVDLCLPDTNRFKGIGVGFAAGFKLTPAIFIVYLFLTRRWAATARAALAAIATVVIGFLILPTESRQFWVDRLYSDPSRLGGIAYVANQSVNGTLIRITGTLANARPYWFLAAAVVAAAGLALAVWLHRQGEELAAILSCALVGLLVSPVSWSHHWVWVIPALALAVDAALRRSPWFWVAVGAILVAFSAVLPPTGIIWQAPNKGDLELQWNLSQSLIGNFYVLVGLTIIVIGGILAIKRFLASKTDNAGAEISGSSAPR